jgi:UDP-N-acetylglucosamine 2-epimerase (non-hydrolysing)
MKKIIHIVGARPNFMKAAPVYFALQNHAGIHQLLVHTGQHYDEQMSEIFFRQLGMPKPDLNLEVGSASHAEMTARIMVAFEKVALEEKPDLLLVYGDVNSTIACALVAKKLQISVAHVEAGLRSCDRGMPEEINRILTDSISDLFFTTSREADELLLSTGVPREAIHFVGNGMIDTLLRLLPQAAAPDLGSGWDKTRYGLITLHRPSNVDDPEKLRRLLETLSSIGQEIDLVFPVHPRTQARFREVAGAEEGLILCEPLGYLEFLWLQQNATLVITDSGGVQEETTWLGVPCLTMRENTERPVTVSEGTNQLIGNDLERLQAEVAKILRGEAKKGRVPEYWDGKAGERTASIIEEWIHCR